MVTNTRVHSVIILFLILSACSPKIADRAEYRYDDVVYRKMRLTFYKDGRLTLDNISTWWIGYSTAGEWNLQNDKMIISIDRPNFVDSLVQIEYPQPGDTVNIERLLTDPGYSTFPVIRRDTVWFSDDHKVAYLKGFRFEHHPSTAKLSRLIKKR